MKKNKRVKEIIASATEGADSLNEYLDAFAATIGADSVAVGNCGETIVIGMGGKRKPSGSHAYIVNVLDVDTALQIADGLYWRASEDRLNSEDGWDEWDG